MWSQRAGGKPAASGVKPAVACTMLIGQLFLLPFSAEPHPVIRESKVNKKCSGQNYRDDSQEISSFEGTLSVLSRIPSEAQALLPGVSYYNPHGSP